MFITAMYYILWWFSLQFMAPYVTIVYFHNGGGCVLPLAATAVLIIVICNWYSIHRLVIHIKNGIYIILSLGLSWSIISFDQARWWTFADPAENLLAISLVATFLWLHWPKQFELLKPALIPHYIIGSSYILSLGSLRPTSIIHIATKWNISPYFFISLTTLCNLPSKSISAVPPLPKTQNISRPPILLATITLMICLWFSLKNTLWLHSPSPLLYSYILILILINVKPPLPILLMLLLVFPIISIETLLLVTLISYKVSTVNIHFISLLFVMMLACATPLQELFILLNTNLWAYGVLSALTNFSLMYPTCEATMN